MATGLLWWQATAEEWCDSMTATVAVMSSDDLMLRFVGPQLLWGVWLDISGRIRARVELLAAEERAQLAEEVEQASIRRLAEEGRHLHLVAA